MIMDNVRLTRGILARLIGVAAQEKVFKFHERFNSLSLNDREMSLLMPTLLTYSSKNYKIYIINFKNNKIFPCIKVDVRDLNYPNQVAELHELYKQALIDEFISNNRSDEFILELVEVLIDLFVYENTAFKNYKYKLHRILYLKKTKFYLKMY